MKETIEKYLLSIGTDAATIAALKADETPEDYNQDEAVKGYLAKRRELVLNDGDLQKDMKKKYNSELYPAMMKPILKELQKVTGLSSEQLKSITQDGNSLPDMKKAIALGIETFGKTAAGGVDEVKQELFDIKAKFETSQSEHVARIEELQNGFAMKIRTGQINQGFAEKLQAHSFTLPMKSANKVLMSEISDNYNIVLDDKGKLAAQTKDGNRPSNEKGFITLDDIILSIAKEFGIYKQSNGGGTGSGGDEGKKPEYKAKEGESDAIRRMREAADRRR